tara:strand:- start:1855 stop:2076 length:222 start_codon:yes stop_codon:yes gene_type:complete
MFIVNIDHLTEDQLEFFGWSLVRETDDMWLYLHVHTGEEQLVDKDGEKFLIIDDVNDASMMSSGQITVAPGSD